MIFNNMIEPIFNNIIEPIFNNIRTHNQNQILKKFNNEQQMVKYIQNYALYESIGSGVYGKVYRAINNNDKKQYAVKVIPIAKFRQNKKLQQCTVNQINILTNIQVNQHIIRYFDMLKTSNNFYFIYEYCNGGTLQGLLSRQGNLSEQSALLIFKQLLEAFQVLNKYNIMHRDLKPDNIFFHNGIIKLGDFGFCKNLNSADQMARTMLGSPIYMAPEVLRGEIYSNKADIWSLGVVLYEMLFGHCPFQSNSIAKLIQVLNTKQLQFPGTVSIFLKDLIMKMLTKDSAKRVGWMQMFQIKISTEGNIQSQKIRAISSLSDAKFSQQNISLTTTKYTPKQQSTSQNQGSMNSHSQSNSIQSPSTNNQSIQQGGSHQSVSPQSVNQQSNNQGGLVGNAQNGSQPQQNSGQNQLAQQVGNNQQLQGAFKKMNANRSSVNQQSNSSNNIALNTFSSNGSSNNININGPQLNAQTTQQMTTQQLNGPKYGNNSNQTSLTSRISEEHKIITEGIKLTMDIIESRLPNYSGYSHLILTKNLALLEGLLQRPFRREILEIIDKQLKQVKAQRDLVTSKMFSYELKGLDDWKKYMRGKFFQDQKTISLWYRMIHFLNNPGNQIINMNLNNNQMADNVKNALY